MRDTGTTVKTDKSAPKWAEGLTHRERRFVEYYLEDLNATSAARKLGLINKSYTAKYSEKSNSAARIGSDFLAKPQISHAIELALNECGVTRVWVINQLAKIARSDLSKFVRKVDGKVVVFDSDKIDPDDLSNMTELSESITEFGTAINVKVHDPKPALFKLAKLLGMEVERQEISGPKGGPVELVDPLARIRERLNSISEKQQKGTEQCSSNL